MKLRRSLNVETHQLAHIGTWRRATEIWNKAENVIVIGQRLATISDVSWETTENKDVVMK